MKTRAAVAWEADKPLAIEEIDLEGPKKGEVLVRIVATGVCHTPLSRRRCHKPLFAPSATISIWPGAVATIAGFPR